MEKVPAPTELISRVIAGTYRSRPLHSIPGLDLRPNLGPAGNGYSTFLRLGILQHSRGLYWIDLFAGTGAVGIEALSRGAAMVYFVESSDKAAELVHKNLKSLGITSGFEVLKDQVVRTLRKLEARKVTADFVFVDPPYRMEDSYKQTLEVLSQSELLKAAGTAIAEHDKRFDPEEELSRLRRYRNLKQGDSVLSFYRTA